MKPKSAFKNKFLEDSNDLNKSLWYIIKFEKGGYKFI